MKREDIISILKGAGIAAIGAVITYVTSYVSGTDFGSWTPVIVMGWSVVANAIRKAIFPAPEIPPSDL